MNLIVIGGGCFGKVQTGRLLTAMDRGLIRKSLIVVVDRNRDHPAGTAYMGRKEVSFVQSDWSSYLKEYFSGYRQGSGDQLVPAHIAPHLLFESASSEVGARTGRKVVFEPVTDSFGLPFEKEAPGGIRYISAAAWLCPFSCIEPEVCPATRGPRDWDLSHLVPKVMKKSADMCVVFKTTHYAWGVGTISCDSIAASYESIAALVGNAGGKSVRVAVATTSNCHGVVGMLRIT